MIPVVISLSPPPFCGDMRNLAHNPAFRRAQEKHLEGVCTYLKEDGGKAMIGTLSVLQLATISWSVYIPGYIPPIPLRS